MLRRTNAAGGRHGLTLIEALIVLGVLGLVLAMLLPATRSSRGAARRVQCKHNLKSIGLAIANYRSEHGSGPPAVTRDADGRPLHSWRTLLLPYLDEAELYASVVLSEPWDAPANAAARDQMPPVFSCPAADAEHAHTTYLAAATGGPGEWVAIPAGGEVIAVSVFEGNMFTERHWMDPAVDERPVESIGGSKLLAHAAGQQVLLRDGRVYLVPPERALGRR